MSNEERIALGALVVAVLSMLGAFMGKILTWMRARHFSIRTNVDFSRNERAYIASIRVFANRPPIVSRLSAWCKLRIWNNGTQAKLIARFSSQEGKNVPRKIIGPPVKTVDIGVEADFPSAPLELPLTLAPHSGLDVWVLVSFGVSDALGEILFDLYGQDARNTDTFRRVHERFEDIQRQVVLAIDEVDLPISDVSVQIPWADLSYPLLEMRRGALRFSAGLGALPLAVAHKVIPAAMKKGWSPDDVFRSEVGSYQVRVCFGDGQIVRHHVKIGHDALWWGKMFARGSSLARAVK